MNGTASTFVLLLGSAAAIYFACEYFVNGVEWVGRKFAIGAQATGSILAAFGTALPESAITLMAVAFGASDARKAIGIGAALGGPLVLATIAYAVVGLTLIASRRRLPDGAAAASASRRLSADQGWFLVIFAAKAALGVVAFAIKPWLGLVFLAAYAVYFRKEMRGAEGDEQPALDPLRISPRDATPSTAAALAQTIAALLVIFAASRVFVGQLDALAPVFGIRPQLLALLLSPIATELPETLNAVIWVRQGKHRLALANISGAMMIQATVPTALGLFFTRWLFDAPLMLAALVTMLAVGFLFLLFRAGRMSRGMLAGMALFYVAFIAALRLFGLA